MSPRSASHRPRHDWRALRDVSPTQGWISDPYLPSSALHGSHCLSRDFTRSAKPALEKQTSQLSPVMQQCMDSAWVWLLAGPIKCSWPSVTLWSVFQYPVTYTLDILHYFNNNVYCLFYWSISICFQWHQPFKKSFFPNYLFMQKLIIIPGIISQNHSIITTPISPY